MSDKKILEQELKETIKNAKFPIEGPQELLTAFPRGADTTYKIGDIEISAEAAENLLKDSDYPLESPEEAVRAIIVRANL
ncbi:MTH865 family protein [Natranaerofaba carboxydovora]|uniref:MTH865 family protein n=1 Tax=Natranaerofaba carboxydovora TaxID=2742683 RepID=UPI001F148D10|nr:MTH865 family protein [Natranaerofaba carboxydovora]UMZ74152.1 MTH865-like family protein [Natranaerofaba carboxydovora]